MVTSDELARFRRRAAVLACTLLLGLLGTCLRVLQLQVLDHGRLRRLAREQSHNTVRVPARRGHIYDRSGSALAINVDVPSVYANPLVVPHAPRLRQRLARILGLTAAALDERLQSERYFAWLRRRVSPAQAEQVAALNIPGVGIAQEARRFYPNRLTGAHVLGFAGADGRGLEGVERQYDAQLLGQPQQVTVVRDARGQMVLAGGLDPKGRARGEDLHLALDLPLQHAAEAALRRALTLAQARAGTAVVLDVATADVLAMATVPDYDPNEAAQAQADVRRNRAVTDTFEPGSALKPLVVALALDAGLVHPNSPIDCEGGQWLLDGHRIRDVGSHRLLSVSDVLVRSSNIGMAKLGGLLGRDRLGQGLAAMGLGQRSGIDLPGEVRGSLRPGRSWSELELGTIAFGQGVAMTPLQLALAYRSIAADGLYRPPRLVTALQRPDGAPQPLPLALEHRIMSAAAARRLTTMLEQVAGPQGSGRQAQVPGYRVAGKTGTAQKSDLVGGYRTERYVGVFAGFLPADAPRVVIVVTVDEPQGVHLGGVVAAPAFSAIGAVAMQRLGVLPSQLTPASPAEPPPQALASRLQPSAAGSLDASSFVGLTARQAVDRFTHLGLPGELEIQGSGRVVRQLPRGGSPGLRLILVP